MRAGDLDWWLLRQGRLGAAWNMALDEALLEGAAGLGRPLLRFYGWDTEAATFGYSQKYDRVAGWTGVRPLVRRPTGGGLVLHNGDFTYTLVFPSGDPWHRLRARESYRRVHLWVSGGLRRLGLATELATAAADGGGGRCFAGPEEHDVLWCGLKVAGAAQRRTRDGLLIQGSARFEVGGPGREAFQAALLAEAQEAWGVRWADWTVEPALEACAQALEIGKYGTATWNEARGTIDTR
jgi:lipoate-protein ligase A